MTTANLMNVSSVKGNISVQVDASKKLQEENLEVAEIFAGMMSQTMDFPNSMVNDKSSSIGVSKKNSEQSPAESYERYSYKDKQIGAAKESSIEEKLDESGETLEETGDKIMDTLCEEYDVDEEVIQNLLDEMGLSVLDLLNPQNLVNFIVQLTGVASGEDLLLDGNFLSVMESLNHLAEGLMNDLNVDMNGLQELVAGMDLVTEAEDVPTDFQEVLNNLEALEETEMTDASAKEQLVDESMEVQYANAEQTAGTEEKQDESLENKVAKQDEPFVNGSEESTVNQDSSRGQSSEGNSLWNQNANETIVNTQTTANVSQSVEMPQMTQFSSYLSADTVQIMEQIVQQMRVTISNEITSMEMQMNPENLGKVYVNISTEEGIVNAQFRATNEVVKEALEAQISTLRESLNQAGVKVDAIEVTIASHEFERNLEQQSQNPEEQMNAQEQNVQRRRNLNLDSLDEISGMMTEEETLVAQIMRDNGNSVDFTA